jgi:NADH dehydrogenase
LLHGGTIVCTIGSAPAPVVAGLDAPKEKGRLLTEPDMRLRGQRNAWAIGDCAYVMNSLNGEPSPTTGQFAERQGRQCAQNISRVLNGQPTQPFSFKLLGELCSIGGHSAVADFLGMHLSGFWAWFLWRGVYLFKLPTIGRRLQVGFDWAWMLLFPRDLAHIRARQSDRVSRAHYEAGEFIFRKGDPSTSFYVLEHGEVEVLRPVDGGQHEVVVVLGAGSFFGERALLGNRTRSMSIRARVAVEVLVMGKNLFTQMSSALAPLREALAQTLNRRSADTWKDQPEAHELLQRTPLSAVMEPVPQPILKPTASLREVGHAFVEHPNDFFCVASDGRTLEGVVTITDLIRARAGTATPDTPLSEFMTKNPVALAASDNCALASAAIREYRLKTLPVVEDKNSRNLIGCVRVRKLMALVFKELDEARPQVAASAKE